MAFVFSDLQTFSHLPTPGNSAILAPFSESSALGDDSKWREDMLRKRITESLKEAMKAKDEVAVSAMRLMQAALKDRDIAARSKGNMDGISDDEILSMLQSMIKQRRDSIELYEKGGRPELAAREAKEIDIIEGFLPEQMDDDAVDAAIKAVMFELEAASMKDMGRVMGALKERHAGSMDFAKASGLVKAKLSG